MNITIKQLRKIISEEVSRVLSEAPGGSLPGSFLEYRRLILDMLRELDAPEQFIMQLGSEGTPASLALETGWMDYEDKAVYASAETKLLADAAYKTVMDASRKYRQGRGQMLDAKPLADAIKREILMMQ